LLQDCFLQWKGRLPLEKEKSKCLFSSFLRKKSSIKEINLAGKLVHLSALIITQNKRYFIMTLGELAQAGSQVSIIVQVRTRVKLGIWE
jgi:hypothetical protein